MREVPEGIDSATAVYLYLGGSQEPFLVIDGGEYAAQSYPMGMGEIGLKIRNEVIRATDARATKPGSWVRHDGSPWLVLHVTGQNLYAIVQLDDEYQEGSGLVSKVVTTEEVFLLRAEQAPASTHHRALASQFGYPLPEDPTVDPDWVEASKACDGDDCHNAFCSEHGMALFTGKAD